MIPRLVTNNDVLSACLLYSRVREILLSGLVLVRMQEEEGMRTPCQNLAIWLGPPKAFSMVPNED